MILWRPPPLRPLRLPFKSKYIESRVKTHQRGVQWKQGVVIYVLIYTSVLYGTTPINCSRLPLHPPCNDYPTNMSPRHSSRGSVRSGAAVSTEAIGAPSGVNSITLVMPTRMFRSKHLLFRHLYTSMYILFKLKSSISIKYIQSSCRIYYFLI